jgi:hypothetical protein
MRDYFGRRKPLHQSRERIYRQNPALLNQDPAINKDRSGHRNDPWGGMELWTGHQTGV